ncbi:hypothetical protein [Nocardiopsis dassonvillei]|uniref:hypothetical protein n=1 Tax=Nocardiopsis dassonvillei TaxID=2014 RepID=UPI00034961E6
MTEPLSAQELSSAPAIIRHLAAHGRRATVDTTITVCSHGYRVTISSAKQDRRIQAHLMRKGRRWWQELAFFEGETEVDVEGGLAEMMRLLSKAGDRVGSPAANTRHQGTNPTLATRSHTIIRV